MGRMQFAVRAKNGLTHYTSEDVALAVATGGDHGYTTGPTRSPLIEAFSRLVGAEDWTRLGPPSPTAPVPVAAPDEEGRECARCGTRWDVDDIEVCPECDGPAKPHSEGTRR